MLSAMKGAQANTCGEGAGVGLTQKPWPSLKSFSLLLRWQTPYWLPYRWTKRVKFSVWCMSWVWFPMQSSLLPCELRHRIATPAVTVLLIVQDPAWLSPSPLEHPPIPPAEGKLLVPWSSVTFRELFKYLSRPAFHQMALSTSASLTWYCTFLNCCKNPGGSGRNGDFSSPDCVLPLTLHPSQGPSASFDTSFLLLVLHWLLIVTLLYIGIYLGLEFGF